MNDKVEQRINDLEAQLVFQEDTINQLNDALVDQQNQLITLQRQLRLFAKKVQDMQPGDAVIPLSQEPPPPHY